MKKLDKLSLILPSYNESGNIQKAVERLVALCAQEAIEYELIFVNDGSQDTTWEEICAAKENNCSIKGICFSRNFGKEAAISAGLKYSSGTAVVIMDCDLQHPPEIIPVMLQLWRQGYEIVEGVKTKRGKESCWHRIAANGFYKILSQCIGINMKNASDFKLLDRKVVDILLSMPEKNSFFRALSSWVGFRSATVSFEVQERTNGNSKWSTIALIRYAITSIAVCTYVPMQFVTICGGLSLFATLITGSIMLIRTFHGKPVNNTEIFICLLFLVGGILMVCLGILGYYVARIYDEVKGRPRYIVSKRIE